MHSICFLSLNFLNLLFFVDSEFESSESGPELFQLLGSSPTESVGKGTLGPSRLQLGRPHVSHHVFEAVRIQELYGTATEYCRLTTVPPVSINNYITLYNYIQLNNDWFPEFCSILSVRGRAQPGSGEGFAMAERKDAPAAVCLLMLWSQGCGLRYHELNQLSGIHGHAREHRLLKYHELI